MTVLFIIIGRMPFLAPGLDNADPLFALVITLAFLSAPHKGGGSMLSYWQYI